MYLLDLYVSNIKAEALAQECSKRKVSLKKICETNWKTTLRRSPFYNNGAGQMHKTKLSRSHHTEHGYFPVKFAKFLRAPLRTKPVMQHLRAAAPVRCYL